MIHIPCYRERQRRPRIQLTSISRAADSSHPSLFSYHSAYKGWLGLKTIYKRPFQILQLKHLGRGMAEKPGQTQLHISLDLGALKYSIWLKFYQSVPSQTWDSGTCPILTGKTDSKGMRHKFKKLNPGLPVKKYFFIMIFPFFPLYSSYHLHLVLTVFPNQTTQSIMSWVLFLNY